MGPALIPAPYRVRDSRRETEDSWTLELEPVAGEPVRCAAGQFTMLYAFGAGEVPISVSGDPANGALVHTVRAVGEVTRSICRLGVGAEVGVRGPFGHGWPLAEAAGRDVVVVAGGVGLAPLRPVVYELLNNRDRYGRVAVLYGGRAPDQLLFRDQLDDWGRREGIELATIVDAADGGWRGRVGVVPSLIESSAVAGPGAIAMVCGPELMMRFSAEALLAAGLSADDVIISMERNMRCAVGHCGHCQWGPSFVCRDGPVFSWEEIGARLSVREL